LCKFNAISFSSSNSTITMDRRKYVVLINFQIWCRSLSENRISELV